MVDDHAPAHAKNRWVDLQFLPSHHRTSQSQETRSSPLCTVMKCVNAANLSSTDSNYSLSDFNQPDFDTPVIPTSEFKYKQYSTLPAKPWPELRQKVQTESVIEVIMNRPEIEGAGLFPDTPEFQVYMQRLRDAGRSFTGGARGRRLKPTSDAPLRRSERLAALNARKEEQEPLRRNKQSDKFAKTRQQPSRTRIRRGRRAVQKKIVKQPSGKTASSKR